MQPAWVEAGRGATARARQAMLPLAGAGACLALAGAISRDPVAALWAKALTDPWLHSTSAGAALYAMLSMAGVLLLAAFCTGRLPLRVRRAAAWTLLAGALAGQTVNLAAHLLVQHRQQMPAHAAVLHWSGETNTSSSWVHSHAGKAALSALGLATLDRSQRRIDAGQGLARQVPAGATALMLATLLAAAAAALALMADAVRHRGRVVTAMLAACSLIAVKAIADGGLLTYGVGPAMAVIAFVLAPELGLRRGPRLALLLGAGVLAHVALWAGARSQGQFEALASWAGLVGALAALSALAGPWRRRPAARAVAWAAGLPFLLLSLGGALLAGPGRLQAPLPAGTRATVCDLQTLACTSRSVQGESALQVYADAGDDPLKPRRVLIWRQGLDDPGSGVVSLLAVVRPMAFGPQRADAAKLLEVRPLRRVTGTDNLWLGLRSQALPRVHADPPAPFGDHNHAVLQHLIAAQLRAQGLHGFTLALVGSHDDAAAFDRAAP